MALTEYPLETETAEEGIGPLIVTDAQLLVRPRKVPGQYPESVSHDTIHAYEILCLGNDMGQYEIHIVSQLYTDEAHKLLDRVFYAFIDACCLELWCDARVNYIVDGETIRFHEYGFEDGQYTLYINVYCGVSEDKTEDFLELLMASQTERFVVVRSDESGSGYRLSGVDVADGQDDDWDPNSPCPDRCGQPVGACGCALNDLLMPPPRPGMF